MTPPPSRLPQPKIAPTDRFAVAEGPLANVRAFLVDTFEDFRSSDKFFKYKVAVIGIWLALSAASVIVAIPSAQSTPDNDLMARVRVQHERLLDYTALLLENSGEEDWTDVVLKLNGAYTAALPQVPAGRNVVLDIRKFTNSSGQAPPRDLKPRKLDLRCDQGRETFDLD